MTSIHTYMTLCMHHHHTTIPASPTHCSPFRTTGFQFSQVCIYFVFLHFSPLLFSFSHSLPLYSKNRKKKDGNQILSLVEEPTSIQRKRKRLNRIEQSRKIVFIWIIIKSVFGLHSAWILLLLKNENYHVYIVFIPS